MKQFKVYLVAIILICILSTSILLCACNPDPPEYKPTMKVYRCKNIENYKYSAIINSTEEIAVLCDEATSPIFQKENYESNKELIEKLKEYDESFFRDNSIVIFFLGHTGGEYYLKNFEIVDESLNLTLANKLKKSAIYPAVVIPFIHVVEFAKDKLNGATKINVDLIRIFEE